MSEEVREIPQEALPLIQELESYKSLPKAMQGESVKKKITDLTAKLTEIEKSVTVTPVKKEEVVIKEKENIVIDTPLVNLKFESNNETTDITDDFTDWKNVTSFAKKYELDLNEPKDLKKVFELIDKNKNELQEIKPQFEEYKNKTSFLESLITNMPPELGNAFVAWTENDPNWKQQLRVVQDAPFDITLPVDKQSELALVNHYGDEKYSNDEWEDMDEKTKKNILKPVKSLYVENQNQFLNYREAVAQNKQKKKEEVMSSVDLSILELKKSNPNISDVNLQVVKSKMLKGVQEDLFEKNGSYKKDAAEKIADMLFAKPTIAALAQHAEKMAKQAFAKGKSEGTEEVVVTGKDKARTSGTETTENANQKYIKEQTSFLKRTK